MTRVLDRSVLADLERHDTAGPDAVAAVDAPPFAGRRRLVDDGLAQPDLPSPPFSHQVPLLDRQVPRALDRHPNRARIGARLHYQVVLHVPVVRVDQHVDAGIQVVVAHLAEARYAGPPLRRIGADQVVGSTGEPADGNEPGIRSRARKRQRDRIPSAGNGHPRLREEEAEPARPRDVANVGISRAGVGFKRDGTPKGIRLAACRGGRGPGDQIRGTEQGNGSNEGDCSSRHPASSMLAMRKRSPMGAA